MSDSSFSLQRLAAALPTDTRYIGTRTSSGAGVVVQTLRGKTGLEPRLDLVRHSPVGFDWAGRGSASGSAQLALALLAHASGDDRFALKHYQVFTHEIVSRLPITRWNMSACQVLQLLHFVSDAPTPAPANSGVTSRKEALIQAWLPGKTHPTVIQARGQGRGVRKAAARGLLNLLKNKHLRRQPITQLQIELSVLNAREAQRRFADTMRVISAVETR